MTRLHFIYPWLMTDVPIAFASISLTLLSIVYEFSEEETSKIEAPAAGDGELAGAGGAFATEGALGGGGEASGAGAREGGGGLVVTSLIGLEMMVGKIERGRRGMAYTFCTTLIVGDCSARARGRAGVPSSMDGSKTGRLLLVTVEWDLVFMMKLIFFK